MFTESIVYGIPVAKILFVLAGTFGGFFPFFYDLITRQKMPKQLKIELDAEFYIVKAIITPCVRIVVTPK